MQYSRQESFFDEGNNLGFSTQFIKYTASGLSFQFWKIVPQIRDNPKVKGINLNSEMFIFLCIQFLRISEAAMRSGLQAEEGLHSASAWLTGTRALEPPSWEHTEHTEACKCRRIWSEKQVYWPRTVAQKFLSQRSDRGAEPQQRWQM